MKIVIITMALIKEQLRMAADDTSDIIYFTTTALSSEGLYFPRIDTQSSHQ